MPRTYAADTSVPIDRTMGQITKLLQEWGCIEAQWGQDWEARTITVAFIWRHEGQAIRARITIRPVPTDTLLKEMPDRLRYKDAKTRDAWLDGEREQRMKAALRVVLVKLKADFAMVATGICSAIEVLLPFIEDSRGRTVAEVVVPRITEQGSHVRLIAEGA